MTHHRPDHLDAREVAIFAADVADKETLIAGLRPGVAHYVLSPDGDGLAEIATLLAGHRELQALHIVAHGEPGTIFLGSTRIDNRYLKYYPLILNSIKYKLSANSEIHVYACNLGQGDTGYKFVQNISKYLQCSTCASNGRIGAAFAGGQWDLDVVHGKIEKNNVFDKWGRLQFRSVLSAGNTAHFDNLSDGLMDSQFSSNGFDFSIDTGNDLTTNDDFGDVQVRAEPGNATAAVISFQESTSQADFEFDTLGWSHGPPGIGPSVTIEGFNDGTSVVGPITLDDDDDDTTPGGDLSLFDGQVVDRVDLAFTGDGSIFRFDDLATLALNNTPTFDNGSSTTITVKEDSSGNDIDSVLAVTDSDGGDTLTWSESSAPNNGGSTSGFTDSASAGTSVTPSGLTYSPGADISGSTAESFDVQVDDGNGATDTITVNVDVDDAPEVSSITRASPSNPTNSSSVTYTVNFSESVSGVDTTDFTATQASGTVSGTVSSVSSGSGSSIDVTVGSITGDGDLRLDVSDDDSITSDSNGVELGGVGSSGGAGDGSFTSGPSFTIDNTAPGFDSGSTATLDENTTGNVLDVGAGDDGTTSPDTDVTYSLSSNAGSDASAFSIDSTSGQLTLDSQQDFESPTDDDTNNDYELTVTATDDVGNSAQQTITVSVNDVDENPTAPNDSSPSTDENSTHSVSDGGALDLLALASDPDTGDSLSVDQIDGTAFSAGSQVSLNDAASVTVNADGSWTYDPGTAFDDLDQGDTTTDSFTYTVKDSDGDTAQGTITLTINGQNDAPTALSLGSTSVNQSGGTNAVVGSFSTTDADTNDTHTYTLVSGTGDGDNDQFNINSGDLRANDAGSLADGTYNVRVETADGNGGTLQNTFTVTVNDDVAPSLTGSTPSDASSTLAPSDDLSLTFDEDVSLGTGNITITDEGDGSSTRTLDVTTSAVSVSGDTITLSPSSKLESATNYHVQVDSTAIDDTNGNDFPTGGGFSDPGVLNFTTADTDPAFTEGASTSVTVLEDGSVDLTNVLEVSDASSSDTLTWEVSAAPSNGSTNNLDGENKTTSGSNSPFTLTTSPTYTPNADVNGSDSFDVQIADTNPGTTTNTITVNVTIDAVNDAPAVNGVTGRDPNFTEGGAAVGVFSGASTDPGPSESGQSIQKLTFTVSNVADGADEILAVDGSMFGLTDGNSVSGTAFKDLDVSVGVSGSTATVDVTKSGGFSAATADDVVNNLSYGNFSNDPGTADRGFTLTEIVDAGGTSNGGDDTASLSASSTVSVTATNDAPSLASAANLPVVNEDAPAPSGSGDGTAVSSIVSGSDAEGDPLGAALTSLDTANGTWHYNTGSGWNPVGSVSASNALLLADDDRLAFEPDADWNGTVSNAVTVRAWDQTSGSAANKVDTTTNGGTTAYSTGTDTADITVDAVNDAPLLTQSLADQSAGNTTNQTTFAGFVDTSNSGVAFGGNGTEGGQSISDFTVTNTDNSLFAAQPDVANNGDLTYTPAAGVQGTATVDVQVVDDGGTANGGSDTSPAKSFAITVDNQAPTVSGASVDGGTLTVNLSETMSTAAGDTPGGGAFTVTAGGSPVTVNNVAYTDATTLDLSLASAVSNGETVTLDHTQGSNTAADDSGNLLAGFSGQGVTNNTPAPPPPPDDDEDEDNPDDTDGDGEDDDLFDGDDQATTDNRVDTGLNQTDDFENVTIDGAPASTGTTTDPETGEDVEVVSVNAVSDGDRVDEIDDTPNVDVDVGDTVRASIPDTLGLVGTSRQSAGRDALSSAIAPTGGGDDDSGEDAANRDAFLDDVVGGADDSSQPVELVELTPTAPATDGSGDDSQTEDSDADAISVTVGDSGDGRNTVVVVDTNALAGGGGGDGGSAPPTVEVTGSANVVVRGDGNFRGTEETASGGPPDVDNVVGDSSDQTLFFGPGPDVIRGAGGDDDISSAGGNDRLIGGTGDDTVRGGAGEDILTGGAGDDALTGGAGTDTADYGDSPNAVTADLASGTATGDGSDTLTGIANIVGSAHGDSLSGDGGDNLLNGAGGDDTLDGGAGDDLLVSGAGDGTLDGGPGADTARFDHLVTDVAASAAGHAVETLAGAATLEGVERIADGSGESGPIELATDPNLLILADGGRADAPAFTEVRGRAERIDLGDASFNSALVRDDTVVELGEGPLAEHTFHASGNGLTIAAPDGHQTELIVNGSGTLVAGDGAVDVGIGVHDGVPVVELDGAVVDGGFDPASLDPRTPDSAPATDAAPSEFVLTGVDQQVHVPDQSRVVTTSADETLEVAAGTRASAIVHPGDGVRLPDSPAEYSFEASGNTLRIERGDTPDGGDDGLAVELAVNGETGLAFEGDGTDGPVETTAAVQPDPDGVPALAVGGTLVGDGLDGGILIG